METNELLLYVGGGVTAFFAAFHLILPKFLNWKSNLADTTRETRGAAYALNMCFALILLGFAVLTFAQTLAMLTTDLGLYLAGVIALFYFLRAGLEPVLFGLNGARTVGIAGLCTVAGACYLLAPLL